MRQALVFVALMVAVAPCAVEATEGHGEPHHHHFALFTGFGTETKPGYEDAHGATGACSVRRPTARDGPVVARPLAARTSRMRSRHVETRRHARSHSME